MSRASAVQAGFSGRPRSSFSVQLPPVEGFDTVIADPLRQGLDAPLLEAPIARPPERLLCASCAPARSSRRRALSQCSCLRLRERIAYELFPQTSHVETLALFTREPASERSSAPGASPSAPR
jgi:hypothetical protein